MHRFPILLFSIILFSFSGKQPPSLIKVTPLMQRIEKNSDTTYVVNFWATWCGPCVKELHCFKEIDSAYAGTKVKVILVSLDFKREIPTKLVPFLESRKMNQEIYVLDETNDNVWIPRVDSSWQGNIPVTLISNSKNKKRVFLPRETSYPELDSLVKDAKK